MTLISTMGAPSSPLFLTGDVTTGIDLSGLDYYYKKKEDADEKLRKKLADEAPEIKEFDQKIDALPGQKLHLYEQYVEKRNKVSEGVKKYGGVWAIYANTPEGRADIGAMGEDPYSFTMAEKNLQRWDDVSKKMNSDGLGKNIYLNKNFRAQGSVGKDGKMRYTTNEDYLQEQAREVPLDQRGRIDAQEYSITTGDSKNVNDEIAGFASKVGDSAYSTAGYDLQLSIDNNPASPTYGQVVTGSGVLDGYTAYNYITTSERGGGSNVSNLRNATQVIADGFSTEAKQGLWSEIYEKNPSYTSFEKNKKGDWVAVEKNIDYNKLDKDDNYRNEVYNGYVYNRVREGVKPFEKTSSTSKTGINVLGQAKGMGSGDSEAEKSPTPLIYSAMHSLIPPDRINRAQMTMVANPDGTYTKKNYVSNFYDGPGVKQELAGINKGLVETPQTLSQYGANSINFMGLEQSNKQFLDAATVVSVNGLRTGEALFKEPRTGQNRPLTSAENAEYERVTQIPDGKRSNNEQLFMSSLYIPNYTMSTVHVTQDQFEDGLVPQVVTTEENKPGPVISEVAYFFDTPVTYAQGVRAAPEGGYYFDVEFETARSTGIIGASQQQEDVVLSLEEQQKQRDDNNTNSGYYHIIENQSIFEGIGFED